MYQFHIQRVLHAWFGRKCQIRGFPRCSMTLWWYPSWARGLLGFFFFSSMTVPVEIMAREMLTVYSQAHNRPKWFNILCFFNENKLQHYPSQALNACSSAELCTTFSGLLKTLWGISPPTNLVSGELHFHQFQRVWDILQNVQTGLEGLEVWLSAIHCLIITDAQLESVDQSEPVELICDTDSDGCNELDPTVGITWPWFCVHAVCSLWSLSWDQFQIDLICISAAWIWRCWNEEE